MAAAPANSSRQKENGAKGRHEHGVTLITRGYDDKVPAMQAKHQRNELFSDQTLTEEPTAKQAVYMRYLASRQCLTENVSLLQLPIAGHQGTKVSMVKLGIIA